jgi:hypothetical protein
MALRGELITAQATFSTSGLTLNVGVDMIDDQFGNLGVRGFAITNAEVIAQVGQIVQAMLPTLEQHIGLSVTLPTAAPPTDGQEG